MAFQEKCGNKQGSPTIAILKNCAIQATKYQNKKKKIEIFSKSLAIVIKKILYQTLYQGKKTRYSPDNLYIGDYK